jgi:hypothetical protein
LAEETGLADELVKKSPPLDQFRWCIELLNLAVVEHDNTITVKDRIDAMSD